jgi:hypothetical protein
MVFCESFAAFDKMNIFVVTWREFDFQCLNRDSMTTERTNHALTYKADRYATMALTDDATRVLLQVSDGCKSMCGIGLDVVPSWQSYKTSWTVRIMHSTGRRDYQVSPRVGGRIRLSYAAPS